MTMSIVRAAVLGAGLALAAPSAFAVDYANPQLLIDAEALAEVLDAARQAGRSSDDRARVVLIDVRPAEAFEAGRIPGAVHLAPDAVADPGSPIEGELRPVDDIARMLGDLGVSADARVVLYDDKGGFHAARMFWVLEYFGHRNAALLDGGVQAWERAGGALMRSPADRPEPQAFSPALSPRRFASADWIMERRRDAAATVVDVRPAAAYAAGHIPWAVNVPWSANLEADKTMKSADALIAHFAARGVTSERAVVVHCQNGLASAHSYFALRLIGHPDVRTYHRSWAEWGSAGDLPVATAQDG
ncbi:MAG: sulfurtransferase [Pseudomonadota bacterium]